MPPASSAARPGFPSLPIKMLSSFHKLTSPQPAAPTACWRRIRWLHTYFLLRRRCSLDMRTLLQHTSCDCAHECQWASISTECQRRQHAGGEYGGIFTAIRCGDVAALCDEIASSDHERFARCCTCKRLYFLIVHDAVNIAFAKQLILVASRSEYEWRVAAIQIHDDV